MKKGLMALTALAMTTTGGSLASIGVSQTNIKHNHVTVAAQIVNPLDQLAAGLLTGNLNNLPVDGSSLTAGLPTANAIPILFNAINDARTTLVGQVKNIPAIGPLLVNILNNLNITDISLQDPTQILTAGQNLVPLALNVGSVTTVATMILQNVKP